ncbi:uncharacterized protein LOC122963305 [Acropora millepora]|uniref:uncharacterized protein LOC122963305 n=1 Tax=Acropora millepora TaxID=45264 RepID=UPI001CF28A51|nr:uncharacterized protein LOC122963305 [Acropora millepora]
MRSALKQFDFCVKGANKETTYTFKDLLKVLRSCRSMALAKRDRKASVALLHDGEEIENYVQSLNKNLIIQRDSFPELSKLRAQHECLDAVEHNDLEKQREISARCQALRTPSGSSRLDNKYKCDNNGLEDFKSNILWTHSSPIEDYGSLFNTTPWSSKL